MDSSETPHEGVDRPTRGCESCSDLPVGRLPVDRAAIERARASRGPATAAVPDSHRSTVFEVIGLDCHRCEAIAECALGEIEGVSNASACSSVGWVSVDYDPEEVDPGTIGDRLTRIGFPVESTDEAFENRRRRQWATGRFATGVLAGSMLLVPYVAVMYPVRAAGGLFYPAEATGLLEAGLASDASLFFYFNLAVLAAIVLLFTGKPIFDRAIDGLRRGVPNQDLVVGGAALGLFVYSTAVAFGGVGGGVHYDVVVGIVVASTVAHRFAKPDPEPADDRVRSGTRPETNGD